MRSAFAFLLLLVMKTQAQNGSGISLKIATTPHIASRSMATSQQQNTLYTIDGVPATYTDLARLKPESIKTVDSIEPRKLALISCRIPPVHWIVVTTNRQMLSVSDADDGHLIENATVSLRAPGKKEFILRTDSAGAVDLSCLRQTHRYEMEISCVGYQSKLIKVNGSSPVRSIQLKKDYKLMADVQVTSFAWTKRCLCWSCRSVINNYGQGTGQAKTIMPQLYPNPAPRRGKIQIVTTSNGQHKIEILNSSGQVLEVFFCRQMRDEFMLDVTTAGIYFVRVTNLATKEAFSIKLLVQ